jgi:hypothetical protein
MAATPMESVPFSELLRRPTETAERLTQVRGVRLNRRDAADLVLMSADRADAEGEVVDLTARLLSGVARRDPDLMREVLLTALPWSRFLPAHEVDTMVGEFIATAQAATSVGNLAPVSQLLIEWRHTAEVHADPDLYRALTSTPLGDFGAVPRPGE